MAWWKEGDGQGKENNSFTLLKSEKLKTVCKAFRKKKKKVFFNVCLLSFVH